MADSASKSPKSADKTKSVGHHSQGGVLRYAEAEQALVNQGTLSGGSSQRKKPCSFQITSVVVGRGNNDAGDDSADDLDESHADDISDVIENSRITDNETPSYSEDTCSKDDIFYNVSSSSLCSAPVIPTSAQYGLAIVSPTGNPNMNNPGGPESTADVNVTLANTTNADPAHHDHKDIQAGATSRNDRFKVVKIESTEPFRRGRWSCMDFLDSANQPFNQTNVGFNELNAEYRDANISIPPTTNYQQPSQSMPVQQLAQNLNQSGQIAQLSQSQYYTSNPVQPSQYNQQYNVPGNIMQQVTSVTGTYPVSQPTAVQIQGQIGNLVQTQNTSAGQPTYSQPTTSFAPTRIGTQYMPQSQNFSGASGHNQVVAQSIVGQVRF